VITVVSNHPNIKRFEQNGFQLYHGPLIIFEVLSIAFSPNTPD
jgi:hypothetical protein